MTFLLQSKPPEFWKRPFWIRDCGAAAVVDTRRILAEVLVLSVFILEACWKDQGSSCFQSNQPLWKKTCSCSTSVACYASLLGYFWVRCQQSSLSHNVFGICCSTVELYKTRCVAAILSLQPEAIKWPSEEERKEIGKRVINKFQIPNCIAIADGTLFPLLQEPRTVDALDYHCDLSP